MKQIILIILTFILLFPGNAKKHFTVSSLIGDHMVLQSGKAFTMNGMGVPGERITAELAYKNKLVKQRIKVRQDGEWAVDFPAVPVNITCEFTFKSKDHSVKYSNIQTGDVWLIMGGSNTVHLLGKADLFEKEKAKNKSGQFRYLAIPKGSSLYPKSVPAPMEWKLHNNQNLPKTPSIAYYLGTTLAENIDHPIGVINCGYGGSIVETWMSAKDLGTTYEALAKKNAMDKKEHSDKVIKAFQNQFPYKIKIDEFDDNRSLLASSDLKDSDWEQTLIPETFEEKGLADFDGVVWFRKEVNLPAGIDFDKISIGYVDDNDEVFINGTFVGGVEDGYGIRRIYNIPEGLLRPGGNTIAVRVRDIGGGGGMYGEKELYYISGEGISVDISGDWKYCVEAIETDVDMNDIHRPGMLFNKMIMPLTKMPVKGIVWYQGEVEAAMQRDFSNYSKNLKTLIKGYRREFKDENLPFMIVQLPSFGEKDATDLDSWVNFKYAQENLAAEMPNTEIISITDLINIKNQHDIHLSNHKATGERLAKTALNSFYKNSAGSLCPVIKNYEIKDGSIVLSLDHAEKLIVNDDYGYIRGFEVAGSNKRFINAKAEVINKNQIRIRINIKNVTTLRYCGKANSIDGNVYNESQMPLMPFEINLK